MHVLIHAVDECFVRYAARLLHFQQSRNCTRTAKCD